MTGQKATGDVFAHSLRDDPDQQRWERLDQHLRAVGALSASFADAFGCATIGAIAGSLHDIGKVSPPFQQYIRGHGPSTDHSTAGAVEAKRLYPFLHPLVAQVIAGHHAGLGDGKDLPARLMKPLAPYHGWEAQVDELPQPRLPKMIASPHRGFSLFFLTRIVFSALVDADFLATEQFYNKAKGLTQCRSAFRTLAQLQPNLQGYMATLQADSELNRLRARILDHALAKAPCTPGLFTFTVPTGGGKTLASLAFALAHAQQHGLRRVIYVAPYTSIIEQTAQVFRRALDAEQDVLEHHGNLDWETRARQPDEADADGLKRLIEATENWDAPVVVTTAVQFFESLFAARPSRCRKLHNIARSVIILDEVQTLPINVLRPCMAALEELTQNYGASVVLCTATQPALRRMDAALPANKTRQPQGFDIGPERELAPDPEAMFTQLKRVEVTVLPGATEDAEIAARFLAQPRMLCIVNSRAHAKALFELIRSLPGARHLTTLMYPAHRRRVLAEIRTALKEGGPVRLVATSLIEAGVDVDFPEVWRAQAGLDSIAQAAGRCNREALLPAGRVVVFSPAEHKPPKQLNAPLGAAQESLNMADPLGLAAVQQYFRALYFSRGYAALDATKLGERLGILPDIERSAPDVNFAAIAAAFRLVDDAMRPVIVAREEAARQALAVLCAAEAPPVRALRKLQQFTVPIPKSSYESLNGVAIQPLDVRFGDRFMVLTDETLYDPECGLRLDDPTMRAAEQNVL